MSNKLTEKKVDDLIETLNALICEDDLLNREQRENMVRTVAVLGGLQERLRVISASKEARKQAKADKIKKPREPDIVFPRTGKIWIQEESETIRSIIDDIPDHDINNHILWLSEKLGRTPYAIAVKIVSEGRMDEEWTKTWKEAAKEIRERHAAAAAAAAAAAEEQLPDTSTSYK